MAVVIVTKHGTAGNPTNLSNGELAVDIAQGRLWVGNLSAPNGRVQIASGVSVENGSNQGELLRWDNIGSAWEADDTLVVADDGSVGIGISTPLRQLHLKGSFPAVRLEDTYGVGSFGELLCSDGSIVLRADHSDLIADSYFRIDIDGSEKLRVTDTGSVGIGTTTPVSLLEVSGICTADKYVTAAGDDAGAPGYTWAGYTNTGMFQRSSASIGFSVGGTEAMYISATGVTRIITDGNEDRIAGTASVAGSLAIERFVTLTQSDYDGLTRDSSTFYIIAE